VNFFSSKIFIVCSLVNDAHSVEFNFGLFLYKHQNFGKSITWLQSSYETRGDARNPNQNRERQAKTAQLLALCSIALNEFDAAERHLCDSLSLSENPTTYYFKLKLELLRGKPLASSALMDVLQHPQVSFELCTTAFQLMMDSNHFVDVVAGCDTLLEQDRFNKNFENKNAILLWSFDALLASGRNERLTEEFGNLVDVCLSCECASTLKSFHLSRWIGSAMIAAASLSERGFHHLTVVLLQDILRLQAHPLLDSEEVLDNASSVNARFLLMSSCLLVAKESRECLEKSQIHPFECNRRIPLDTSTFDKHLMLSIAVAHAECAATKYPKSFPIRSMCCRVYLAMGDERKAIGEIAALSLCDGFDLQALCTAALDAQELGAKRAMLSSFLWILQNPDYTTSENHSALAVPTAQQLPKNFIGVVLKASVALLYEELFPDDIADESDKEKESEDTRKTLRDLPALKGDEAALEELIRILQQGIALIEDRKPKELFGEDKEIEASLEYLSDVCWNLARVVSSNFRKCSTLLELCHKFGSFRKGSVSTLHSQKFARVMYASTILDHADSEDVREEHILKCISAINEARVLITSIDRARRHGATLLNGSEASSDPALLHLALLDVRSRALQRDSEALHRCVVAAIEMPNATASLLETIAFECLNARGSDVRISKEEMDFKERAIDSSILALRRALEMRLKALGEPDANVSDKDKSSEKSDPLARLIRELIRVSIARRAELGLNFVQTAEQLIEGKFGSYTYPAMELYWLAATAWNHAQLLSKGGKEKEACRWAASALNICKRGPSSPALRSITASAQEFMAWNSGQNLNS